MEKNPLFFKDSIDLLEIAQDAWVLFERGHRNHEKEGGGSRKIPNSERLDGRNKGRTQRGDDFPPPSVQSRNPKFPAAERSVVRHSKNDENNPQTQR